MADYQLMVALYMFSFFIAMIYRILNTIKYRGGGVVLLEFLGEDVPLEPWNPQPITELVQLNFATQY